MRVLLLPLLVFSGCLGVADGRARRDQQIGKASAGGLSVAVDDGLANVRAIGAGDLELWAQAPVVAFTLSRTSGDAAPVAVTVDNALSDAALAHADGRAIAPLPAVAGEPPTLRRWRVDLDASGQARLVLRPPDADSRATFRFAVFADVQERIDDVGDIYRRMNEDPQIRFVLMSGDLTNRGTRKQLARFQDEMRALAIPIYMTLGNHELGTRDEMFHDFFGRGSFSFAFRGARVTLLDSASATISPLTLDALDGWLAAGKDAFHLVGMHIPPFDPVGLRGGGFASHLEASALVGRLAAAGVDVTVYGHVHSFYAFANAGIPAYISGGGGAIPERFDGIGRHFLTVDVDPDSQRFQVAVVRVD